MNHKQQTCGMQCDLLLVLDASQGRVDVQYPELIAFAKQLECLDPDRIMLFMAGKTIAAAGHELALKTGLDVIVSEDEQLNHPNPELLRNLLLETVAEFRPRFVCLLHSMSNCQTVASLSALTGAACITAVETCVMSEQGPVLGRAVFNGKLLQSVLPLTPATIITILPGAFRPGQAKSRAPERQGRVLAKRRTSFETVCKVLEVVSEPTASARLEEAEVVVAAGRGIGARENLTLVEETARMFANSAVAASRPLCDAKWTPYSRQVGSTGRSIAPRLYLACGISGAQQHLAGIRGAQFTVAINTDPDAAIFSHTDCIIVEDAVPFLRQLVKQYAEIHDDIAAEKSPWE